MTKPKLYPFGSGDLLKDFRQSSDLDKFEEQDAHALCHNPVSGTWEVCYMFLKLINSYSDSI